MAKACPRCGKTGDVCAFDCRCEACLECERAIPCAEERATRTRTCSMNFIIEIAEEGETDTEWINADLFAQRNADDDELMEAVARLRDGAKRVVLGGGACPMVTMTRREHRSAVTR